MRDLPAFNAEHLRVLGVEVGGMKHAWIAVMTREVRLRGSTCELLG